MTTTPAKPSAYGVHIDAQPGHATISIDGTPIPPGQVIGYRLEHDITTALPMLVLHVREPAAATWEGLAHVTVADPQHDPGEDIAGFLAGINPAAVQAAALDRPDLGDDKTSVTEAILRTLTEWAQGGNP